MKGRKHRNTGGANEAAEDIRMKPERRNNASKIFGEAEKRKHGGKVHGEHAKHHAGKMHGEHAKHHGGKMHGEHAKHHVGKVHGEHAKHHAGRKPRKSGGSCDSGNPFSSARHGTAPKGRKTDMEMD